MTDKELIARLRSMHWCVTTEANGVGVSDSAVAPEAADRIEALTEQLTAAQRDAKEAEAYAEELERELNTCRMAQAVMDNTVAGLEELEAKLTLMMTERDEAWKRAAHAEKMWGEAEVKLAKAVDAINVATRHEPKGLYPDHVPNYWLLRATLAEIKGESHE